MSQLNAFRYSLVAFLLSSALSHAAEMHDPLLRGQVVDTADKPVPDAMVLLNLRLGHKEDLWQLSTTTDSEGKFEMSVPAKWLEYGAYYHDRSVWVHAPGFAVGQESAAKQLNKRDEEPLVIKLAEEEPVKFEIHQPSGKPLVGGKVQPHHWHTGHIPPEEILDRIAATTDAEGVATLHGIAPDLVRRVDVIADQYGKQSFVTREMPADADQPTTLTVIDVGSIEGQLVCDDPVAVSNVRVAVVGSNRDGGQAEGSGETMTDDKGRFRLEQLAAGRYDLYVEAPEGTTYRPIVPREIVVSTDEVTNVDVEYGETVLVRGMVDARGTDQPVAGAYVSVSHGSSYQRESVLTDAQGRFEARVLPGRVNCSLIVIPKDFSAWVRVRATNNSTEVTLQDSPLDLPPLEIAKSQTIEGTLLATKGEPVPTADVRAQNGDTSIGWGRTDEQGKFKLQLPEGTEVTEWSVSLPATTSQPAEIVSDEPLVLRIQDPDVLAGVTETRSLTPADKLQPPFAPWQEENAMLIVAKNVLIFEGKSTTWADLADELDRRAGTKGGDLATVNYYRTYGVYQNELRSQEAESWSQLLTDTSGVRVQPGGGIILNHAAERFDALEITDQWPPGAEQPISGRVVDAEGNPVADAQVVLLPPSTPGAGPSGRQPVYLGDGQIRDKTDHIIELSDGEGKFRFDFPTANTNVMVTAPQGFALVVATSSGQDIKLAPWARVTMKIPQNKKLGVQTASISVNAKPAGGGAMTFIHLSQGSPTQPQRDFEFLAVPPLQEIQASRTLWNGNDDGIPLGRTQGQPYKFTAEPGMTHHLEFKKLEKAEEE